MAAPKLFLDTNIFLRAIVKDERRQANDCLHLLTRLTQGTLSAFTSSIVAAEISWTLLSYYRYRKIEVAEILAGLAGIKSLKIKDAHNLGQAVEFYQKRNAKFIDCLIASGPEIASGKVAVVSYDKDFDKLGIKRLEPRQLV